MHTGFWWGRRLLGKHKHNINNKDNIKMDLREVGWEGMDWIDLA